MTAWQQHGAIWIRQEEHLFHLYDASLRFGVRFETLEKCVEKMTLRSPELVQLRAKRKLLAPVNK